MRIIRASEIGTYQFCHRAWWYRIQGEQPDITAQMDAGNEIHHQHGQSVMKVVGLRITAYLLILLALVLLITHVSIHFL